MKIEGRKGGPRGYDMDIIRPTSRLRRRGKRLLKELPSGPTMFLVTFLIVNTRDRQH
jgi:hypothetical protein